MLNLPTSASSANGNRADPSPGARALQQRSDAKAARQGSHPPALLFATQSPAPQKDTKSRPNSKKSCTKGLVDHIRGANPPPVLLRERVVGECLLDRRFYQLGGPGEAQATQLLDHSDGLLARCRDVLACVDRLEHGRNLPHLGRGHVTEDIAVPMYDAPLLGSLWKELRGALGKPNAGIRGD